MAINAYTGLMGSGKSFEVVANVIVPAVLAGRRVVTNIDGINPTAIHEYCVHQKKANVLQLGAIINVNNNDVMKDGFFPDEEKPDVISIVQPGDLVAIDEAWEFWSISHKIKLEHMRFFRMHRHYVHPETSIACDVALMIQSITDLHRQLKAVVELTFRTKKLKELGASKFYRVEMFEGSKLTKSTQLDTFNKKYDKAIFPLYQSYSGGAGKEKAIDKRQNLLTNKRIWFFIVLLIVIAFFSIKTLLRFFSGADLAQTQDLTQNNAVSSPANISLSPNGETPPAIVPNGFSTSWRIAGVYEVENERWVVVSDELGQLRVESPSMFQNTGVTMIGEIDNQRVTRWSGPKSTTGIVGGPS